VASRAYLMADRGDGRIVTVERRASFANGREEIRWPREGSAIRIEPRAWWLVSADSADAARRVIECERGFCTRPAFVAACNQRLDDRCQHGTVLASGGQP
jgi:hypothetical protein